MKMYVSIIRIIGILIAIDIILPQMNYQSGKQANNDDALNLLESSLCQTATS